jgi:hypothetical protein
LKAIDEILPAAEITAQLHQCRCHSGTHPVCYIDKDHPGPGLQLVRVPAPAVAKDSALGCVQILWSATHRDPFKQEAIMPNADLQ